MTSGEQRNGGGSVPGDDFLQLAVQDAGRLTYGSVMTELWVMNENRTALFRPEDAWWVDDDFASRHECAGEDCELCKLVNRDHEEYAEAEPIAPGVGLPGSLWSEASRSVSTEHLDPHPARRVSVFRRYSQNRYPTYGAAGGPPTRRSSVPPLSTAHLRSSGRSAPLRRRASLCFHDRAEGEDGNHDDEAPQHVGRCVNWRDVKGLANDPDQPWDGRLKLLAKAGIGWAAAVPFHIGGQEGIVLFHACETVELHELQESTNEVYMRRSTDLIGAAYALQAPRKAAFEKQQMEIEKRAEKAKLEST